MSGATDAVQIDGQIHAVFTMVRDGKEVTWEQDYTGVTKWIEAGGREVITLIK